MKIVEPTGWGIAALVWLLAACERNPGNEAPSTVEPEAKEATSTVPKSGKKAEPVENIDTGERLAAASLVEAVDPVAREIKIYRAEIRGAFDEKRFAFIEEKAAELRSDQPLLFADGSWKFFHFYEALDDRFHTGEDGFLTDLETHRAWEKERPDSIARRIALADMMVSYAWEARGTGYANTVTPEGWRLMRERLGTAAEVLEEARKKGPVDIYWYSTALMVGLGQGWEKTHFDQVVEDALKAEPAYWHIQTERAYSLLPRWYGEEGDWQAYALEVAKDPAGLGDEAYARIVMRLSRYYADMVRDARTDWPRTKNGMEKLLEKHPESITLQNHAARLGAYGRDREFTKFWFDKLGDSYVKDVWKKPERFVHFRGWAETGRW